MYNNYRIITASSFEKARNEIDKAKKEKLKIIFYSEDDELNRKVLEKLEIDTLLINQSNRKDFSKQRDSGFNQVLAKAAKKNDVVIGINLDEIFSASKEKKAELLARIRQNIKLCKKNKLKMKFISQKKGNDRNIYDLSALGLALKMPTSMTKEF